MRLCASPAAALLRRAAAPCCCAVLLTAPRCCCFCRLSAVAPARVGHMHHWCGTSALDNLLWCRSCCLTWQWHRPACAHRQRRAREHARATYTLHGPTGEARRQSILTHVPPLLCSDGHNQSARIVRDQREPDQREANVREDGQEHHGRRERVRALGPKAPTIPTTCILIVSCCWPHVLHRWRSPPRSIYRADATSPRALPTPSPKWTVLRPASPGRPAAVTTNVCATAEPATAEMGDEVTTDMSECVPRTRTEVLATRLPPYHPHPACRLSDVIVSRVSAQVRAWF